MADRAPPNLPPLIDNPLAPEFFADEATGFFVHQGNLSITFSSARVDHRSDPGPVSPVAAAAGLAVGLYDFLKKMGIETPEQAAH